MKGFGKSLGTKFCSVITLEVETTTAFVWALATSQGVSKALSGNFKDSGLWPGESNGGWGQGDV